MRELAFAAVFVLITGGAVMSDEPPIPGMDAKTTARIQHDIEKYRKGEAVIRVLDERGQPVEGVMVRAEQLSHNFLFGCNIYMFDRFDTEEENARYRDLFKRVMNYATLPFYWRSFEREQGKAGYERVDAIAEWCNASGVTTKGHPLVWTHEAGVPVWLDESDPEEVKRLLEARVKEIVSRYKGRIDIWDVVNESTHTRTFGGMNMFDYTSEPVRWAREAAPKAMLLVNEFGIVANPKGTAKYYDLLKEMKDKGVPYDAIGVQTHMHGGPLPIDEILKACDKLSELGKPIHFTETTVLSGRETNPADEKTQARYVDAFYRACFSHPSVKAITWWDFSDRGAWQGVAAGLVRKDLTPKPAYLVLDRLINKEWHTSAEGKTDSTGSYAFRGYHGKYDVRVTDASGREHTAEIHVSEGGPREFVVRL